MALHDYNSDETRLGRGLGRTLDDSDVLTVDVSGGGTDSTNEVPASAIHLLEQTATLPATTIMTVLPANQLADSAGTLNCTDCTPDVAAAKAAATAAAVITPLPAAPTTVNWLLIVLGLGLTYAVVKSNSPASGLGNTPEPAPAPTPVVQPDLGRPPSKRKKAAQHVETLSI